MTPVGFANPMQSCLEFTDDSGAFYNKLTVLKVLRLVIRKFTFFYLLFNHLDHVHATVHVNRLATYVRSALSSEEGNQLSDLF